MRAGDRDHALALHEPGHHLRAQDDGDAAAAGLGELRVVVRGRGGRDDELRVAEVGGVVALVDLGAEGLERAP